MVDSQPTVSVVCVGCQRWLVCCRLYGCPPCFSDNYYETNNILSKLVYFFFSRTSVNLHIETFTHNMALTQLEVLLCHLYRATLC